MSLDLESVASGEILHMKNIYVVNKIPAMTASVDVTMYEHLKGLSFTSAKRNAHVDLLIGQDYTEALVPLEVRKGKRGEPFATRTLFGLSLNGMIGSSHNPASTRVSSNFITTRSSAMSLDEQVK